MSWLGIWHHDAELFDPAGLRVVSPNAAVSSQRPDGASDALLVKGSLVFEVRLPETDRPEPLVVFETTGDWPLRLSISSLPGGAIGFELQQYAQHFRQELTPLQNGRGDWVRITYSWDAPRFDGRLAVERQGRGMEDVPGLERAQIWSLDAPRPWRMRDLQALLSPGQVSQSQVSRGQPASRARFTAPNVVYIALSDQIEPVGPMPGLAADTPIATVEGECPIATLKRGDLLRCLSGDLVPILHVVAREVPAFGAFAPMQLHAPYFGLTQDLVVAPYQRFALTGSQVDYIYGSEAVLAPVSALKGARVVQAADYPCALVRYYQLILPQHDVALAAGLGLESAFLGRIRRDRKALAASVLSDVDRNALPEHAQLKYPVVRAFEGTVLTDQRLA